MGKGDLNFLALIRIGYPHFNQSVNNIISQHLHQLVLHPHCMDPLSVPTVKNTLALHHILHEVALEQLAVGKLQLARPTLEVLVEMPCVLEKVPS